MIDFDLTKIKALVFDVDGVLSTSTIAMDDEGQPLRTLNVKDGYAIQLAVKRGLVVAIISGGHSPNIRLRYEYLGVKHIFLSSSYKIRDLETLTSQTGITLDQMLYMGDDIPDYEVMQLCGCPCCPKDAAQEIKDLSIYVSPYNGGEGCARDIIEQVLKAKGLWLTSDKAFGW